MLKDLLAFEGICLRRQPAFIAAVLLFAGLGFLLAAGGGAGGNIHRNAPFQITQTLGMISLGSIFVLSLLGAAGVLRDREHRMEAIIFATGISKYRYLLVRFCGFTAMSLVAVICAVPGMALGFQMPWVDPQSLGPESLLAYLWPLLVLVVPNVLFGAAVIFCAASLIRKPTAVYLGGICLYMLYFIAAILGNSPIMANSEPTSTANAVFASLTDPYGLAAFLQQTQYWEAGQRNTQLVALNGVFLANRLIWGGVTLILILTAFRIFRFAMPSRQRPSKAHSSLTDVAQRPTAVSILPEMTAAAKPNALSAFISRTAFEAKRLLFSRAFAALASLWVFFCAITYWEGLSHGEFDTATMPVTAMFMSFMSEPLRMLGVISLIFFGGEAIWRERDLRVHTILDGMPNPPWVIPLAKLGALFFLIWALISLGIVTAIMYQWSKQFTHIEWGAYFSLFYYYGAPLFLVAILVFFTQCLIPRKYPGMLAALAVVLVFQSSLGVRLGLAHPLLRFGRAPLGAYSGMGGWGPQGHAFHWFVLYWGGLAVVLAWLACRLWPRGTAVSWRSRTRAVLHPLPTGLWPVLFLLVSGLSGLFIYNQLHIRHQYMGEADRIRWHIDFEKQYAFLKELAQPSPVALNTQIQIYPAGHLIRLKGRMILANQHQEPVNDLWLALHPEASAAQISLDQGQLLDRDHHFNMWHFGLHQPLLPGNRIALDFQLDVDKSGFSPVNPHNIIIANGTFSRISRNYPTPGYAWEREMRNPRIRQRHGLPPRDEMPNPGEAGAESQPWIQFEAVVSVPAGQTAVAPGDLLRQWQEAGRQYFHYRTVNPVPMRFAVAAAEYEVLQDEHHGVAIEILFHPNHGFNVPRMMAAAKHSLETFSREFGPYPHKVLRILEITRHNHLIGATAYPNTVYFVEHRGFLADLRNGLGLDYVYRRTAHEIAHQWWGGAVVPKLAKGYSTLTETLAKYAEALVLEQKHGPGQTHGFAAYELDLYLKSRGYLEEPEQPLALVDGQPHVAYQKGALVMMALRERMGEARLNHALKRFVQEFSHPRPSPDVRDLVNILLAEAEPAEQHLIQQSFFQTVFYDLKIEAASSRQLPDGRFQIDLSVYTAKKQDRSDGTSTPLPVDETFGIGLFRQHPGEGEDPPLYWGKHHLRGGRQQIRLVVAEPGSIAAVDPYIRHIDPNRFDNFAAVIPHEQAH